MSRSQFVQAAGVTFLAIAAAGCWGGTRVDNDAFVWSNEIPAGATVHLRNLNGNIIIKPASSSTGRIQGSRRWRGRSGGVSFISTQVGNDVYVCAIFGDNSQCNENGYRAGRRRFMRFFRVPFSSNARATITAELPEGVLLDARTTTGSVTVDGARAGGDARTVNGSVTIRNSAGSFVVHSVNGNLRVAFDSLSESDSLHLETVNGTVRADLPRNFAGMVDVATVNGSVRTDFPIKTSGRFSTHHLTGRVGESSRQLTIRTVNGSVAIRELGDIVER